MESPHSSPNSGASPDAAASNARTPLPPALPVQLEQELRAIYTEVDLEIEKLGVECWLKKACCDFERVDHRLYASSVEIAFVRQKHPLAWPHGSVLCPFWQDGLCTERERRPLGCRTYFCDASYREALEALYEKYYARIRTAAQRVGYEWSYQAFVAALRRPESS